MAVPGNEIAKAYAILALASTVIAFLMGYAVSIFATWVLGTSLEFFGVTISHYVAVLFAGLTAYAFIYPTSIISEEDDGVSK